MRSVQKKSARKGVAVPKKTFTLILNKVNLTLETLLLRVYITVMGVVLYSIYSRRRVQSPFPPPHGH